MDKTELSNKIFELISSKREGDYWDFKQCHHENKADLLHDIICMANNRSGEDGYIIYGVEDKSFKISGVEGSNVREQQCIINFLKDKSFARDVRPKVQLIKLNIFEHEIDILIVENTLETPYYLTKDYSDNGRVVKANYIYTRVVDTNTPINSSADDNHVEFLWKKRFGLHLSPIAKFGLFLNNKNEWSDRKANGNENVTYYKSNPEYTLLEVDDNDSKNTAEFYAYTMIDNCVSYGKIYLKYFGTILYRHQTVLLDGGRYFTVVPMRGFIKRKSHKKPFAFRYFVKSDISYLLHEYLLNEESEGALSAYENFKSVVLYFNTEDEKNRFVQYAENNSDVLEEVITCLKEEDYLDIEESNDRNDIIQKLCVATVLKKCN